MAPDRWKLPLVVFVAVTAGISFGVLVARARPGAETRKSLSFAGQLTGVTGPQTLTFSFKKDGAIACEPKVSVTPDSRGAFNVEIPLTGCPAALFDGSDVVFDVSIGSTVVASNQPVNPVPYARYADSTGSPDCPVGYGRDTSITKFILCTRATDEVVKVGDGPSAFWVDRYEASVWSAPDGTGTQYGSAAADFPASFPENGQWTVPLYALSKVGVLPSRNLTWYQAVEGCANSGKRLPRGSEWLRAARGTTDPGTNDGSTGSCVTKATGPRKTGLGVSCLSATGAQDMVGNVYEWTDDAFAGLGNSDVFVTWTGASYNSDGIWNVAARSQTVVGTYQPAPVIVARGGDWSADTAAGIFAQNYGFAPSFSYSIVGFRCVIPR